MIDRTYPRPLSSISMTPPSSSMIHHHHNPTSTQSSPIQQGLPFKPQQQQQQLMKTLNRNFPSHQQLSSSKATLGVAKWIFVTAGCVAGMVNVGGMTRLTKSGLSMTTWKPFGSLPPIGEDEWRIEFERYKLFPEWQQRKSMTVDEFKYIYYWEWGHRMMGRTIGLVFVLPWAYITYKGLTPQGYNNRLRLLLAMGGGQGLVGWWMVKSGLGEDRRGDKHEIRVTPYRLAAHLCMAFATYGTLVWTGLGIQHIHNDRPVVPSPVVTKSATASSTSSALTKLIKSLNPASMQRAILVRSGAMGVTSLAALTIVSGAFVAGNDAGHAYNTFPQMNDDGGYVPPWNELWDVNTFTGEAGREVYRNIFENTAMVQFTHRVLGVGTALTGLGISAFGLLFHLSPSSSSPSPSLSMKNRNVVTSSPSSLKWYNVHPSQSNTPQVRRGLLALGSLATCQASLGVATLVNCVPVGLAAMHQLGALAVVTAGTYTIHSLRYAAVTTSNAAGGSGLGMLRSAMSSTVGGGVGAMGGVNLGATAGVPHTVSKTASFSSTAVKRLIDNSKGRTSFKGKY